MTYPAYRVGIDIGSTTIKLVMLDRNDELVYDIYERHGSDVRTTMLAVLQAAQSKLGDITFNIALTGSGALDLASKLEIPHIQEVKAAEIAIRHLFPDATAAIDLGGEDAKVIVFKNGVTSYHMNDACAGGTGAFLDQMASLLNVSIEDMNELAAKATKPCQIPSRCGVFAKTEIQTLINANEPIENIAAGIYAAIANQSIGQLAKGELRGKQRIIFLGGPLSYSSELRQAFRTHAWLADSSFVLPKTAKYCVAIGAAMGSAENAKTESFSSLLGAIQRVDDISAGITFRAPLFDDDHAYQQFLADNPIITHIDLPVEPGAKVYLGIDAGSTTRKVVAIDDDGEIVWSDYDYNRGSLKDFSARIRNEIIKRKFEVMHATAIGYGEKFLISDGLATSGEVETIAHLEAARKKYQDIDFVIDIGGQDVKIFHFEGSELRDVQLNEACSSGCGSFIKTYAETLGLSPEEFDQKACSAQKPVDLGSRCTVFMNSNVKSAQRHGASIADIAAGISYSVIANVLYKVTKTKLYGTVIAQGGTLWNNSVLRALELETDAKVIRPDIAGLMGAYGAALLAQKRAHGEHWFLNTPTDINMQRTKLDLLVNRKAEDYRSTNTSFQNERVGIPLALGMFEDYPFWHAFFSNLGYEVVPSNLSNAKTYERGIGSIFSGTVCYPAKLLHGHVIDLVERNIKFIWMPFIKWELSENRNASNHYNCPVVMGYPYAVKQNMAGYLTDHQVTMFADPLPLDNLQKLQKELHKVDFLAHIPARRLHEALIVANGARTAFHAQISLATDLAIAQAKQEERRIIILAGHPYHIDPEVSHDYASLINELGVAVITEDGVANKQTFDHPRVLDQWVYHSRLYRAAVYAIEHDDTDLIQIVSFGCGIDAVTSTQVQEILQNAGKPYTQLKVDDVRNPRAALIRIRSLLALK